MEVVSALFSSAELDAINDICSEGSLAIALAFTLFYLYKAYIPKKVCKPKTVESPWTKFESRDSHRHSWTRLPRSSLTELLGSLDASSDTSAALSSAKPRMSLRSNNPRSKFIYANYRGDIAELINVVCEMPLKSHAAQGISLFQSMCIEGTDLIIAQEVAKDSCKHTAVDFYVALMQCYLWLKDADGFFQLLENMRTRSNVERTQDFYVRAMCLFSANKHYKHAMQVYDEMLADGLTAGAVTLNCLVSFAAQLQDVRAAERYFDQLARVTTPCIRTCMTMMQSYAKAFEIESGERLMERMLVFGTPVDYLIINLELTMCASKGQMEKAKEIVQRFGTPSNMDVVNCNAMLMLYARSRDANGALQLLLSMVENKMEPTIVSFNKTMDAALLARHTSKVLTILPLMAAARVKADTITWKMLTKLLSMSTDLSFLQKVADVAEQLESQDAAGRINFLVASSGIFESSASPLEPSHPQPRWKSPPRQGWKSSSASQTA